MTTRLQSCSWKRVQATVGGDRSRTCWTRRPAVENSVEPYRSRDGRDAEHACASLGPREGGNILCGSSQQSGVLRISQIKLGRHWTGKAYPGTSPRADRGSGGMEEDAETGSALWVPGKSMAIGLLLLLGPSLKKLGDLRIVSGSRGRVLISISEGRPGSVSRKPRNGQNGSLDWRPMTQCLRPETPALRGALGVPLRPLPHCRGRRRTAHGGSP